MMNDRTKAIQKAKYDLIVYPPRAYDYLNDDYLRGLTHIFPKKYADHLQNNLDTHGSRKIKEINFTVDGNVLYSLINSFSFTRYKDDDGRSLVLYAEIKKSDLPVGVKNTLLYELWIKPKSKIEFKNGIFSKKRVWLDTLYYDYLARPNKRFE